MLQLLLGGSRDTGFKKSGLTAFAFEIDAILSENHLMRSLVTSSPVEDGATIADHIILQPEEISIRGIVSNTPVKLFGIGAFEDRVQNAMDTLQALRESKEMITVVSELKVYDDMVFTEIQYPRDQRTGQVLEFKATLQKIRKVQFQTTSISPTATDSDQAKPEQDVGSQSTTSLE